MFKFKLAPHYDEAAPPGRVREHSRGDVVQGARAEQDHAREEVRATGANRLATRRGVSAAGGG